MITFINYIAEAEKIKANRGDVAEALLGAAITMKFLKPTEPVTYNDINRLLDKTLPTGSFKIKSQTPDKDLLEFRIAIPKKAHVFLSSKEMRTTVKDLYDSVIAFTQKDRRILRISKFLSNNGKVDNILINSDGTGDQKGTKADIKLIVNGKPLRNQISLKVTGGDQFAQVSGFEFKKQVQLWSAIGLDVGRFESVYNKAIKAFDKSARFSSRTDEGLANQKMILKKASAIIYKDAAEQLNQKLGSDQKDVAFMKRFTDFIKSKATGDDGTVELLKLTKGNFKKIRFDNAFARSIAKRNFRAEFKATGDPIVRIIDTTINKVVLQIRVKIEGASSTVQGEKVYKPYMRNYIEAKDELFNK